MSVWPSRLRRGRGVSPIVGGPNDLDVYQKLTEARINLEATTKLAESYRLGWEADHERAARLERWVSDLSRSLDLAYRTVEERDEAIEYWSKMAEGRGAAIERLTKAILKHREVRRRRKHGVRTYDADLYKEIER